MEPQTFADGIGRIAIIDGIVRLDLIAHSTTETLADGSPRPVFAHRLLMGTDQFLRAADRIAEAARVIRESQAKTVKPAEAPAAPQPAATQSAAPKPAAPRPEPLRQPEPPRAPLRPFP